MITYFQAILLGILQGISELFPISSIGHLVVLPWLFGWHGIVAAQSQSESYFLSFLVMLHVGTAIALLIFYRKTWVRIIRGFFQSVNQRQITSPDARLAWLLVVATIPAGIVGLLFEHALRTQFAKPILAMIFLIVNGCILLAGDHYQQTHGQRRRVGGEPSMTSTAEQVSHKLTLVRAALIGTAQISALIAGISRSGITMVSGLYSGLNNEDAARFSFLLATPIILGAGTVKLPDFFSNLDTHVRGQILLGGVAAGIAAYFAVKFLDKYFQNKSLRPFGWYCIIIGVLLLVIGLIRGHF